MIRSSASVTPSTSAAAALMNHCRASSPLLEREQRLGVGVEQAGRGLTGARRVEVRRGQDRQSLVHLSQIRPGAGHDDPQFVGVVAGRAGRPRDCGPIRSPVRGARAHARSRRSAAAAGTCCPAGGPLAVRRVPAPSHHTGRPRCRRLRGPLRCGPSVPWRPGHAPTRPRDPRRGVRRPPPGWRATKSAVLRSSVVSSRRISGASCRLRCPTTASARLGRASCRACGRAARGGRDWDQTSAAPAADAAAAGRRCHLVCPAPRMSFYPVPIRDENWLFPTAFHKHLATHIRNHPPRNGGG